MRQEIPQPLEEIALATWDAEELGGLADGNRHGQTEDEAGEDWFGEELRHKPETGEPRDQRHHSGCQGESGRQGEEAITPTWRESGDARG